ncbi:MAG: DUF3102 domain-containing protein [Myxococcota bacterium]|nr:DUF3102 domain-containing protein [Myxococcota bacterium]
MSAPQTGAPAPVARDGRGIQTADRPHDDSAPVVPTLREHHARVIRDAMQRSVAAIVATGQRLADAKADLPHGEFQEMVRRDLGWTPRTAQRLMAIAAHPVLSDATHVSLWPPSWGTLAELARLDDDEITTAIESGAITPATTRAEATAMVARSRPRPAQAAPTAETHADVTDRPVKPVMRRTRDRAAHEQIESALDTLEFHATHIAKLVDAVDDTTRLRAIRTTLSRIIATAEARS